MYPTKDQIIKLSEWLDLCRELYNSAVRERNDAYKLNRVSCNYQSQNKQLTEIKQVRPEYKEINSHVLQDVLERVDKSFKTFFRAQSGYPRYKRPKNYKSFSFPATRYKIDGKYFELSRFGRIKFNPDCAIEGTLKTATIKESCGKWYVSISVEFEPRPMEKTGRKIGIDLGIKNLLTFSDGEVIENERILAKHARRLRVLNRRVARRKKFSNGWKEAVLQLKKHYEKTANHRRHVLHVISTRLVSENDLIKVEDFNIAKLVEGEKNAKLILDAAWGYLREMLEYKADWYGKEFVKVDSRHVNPKGVKFDSLHTRNVASAQEVLRRNKKLTKTEGVN